MHVPAVSVVMSCYNAARWLREAVDSVAGQTLADWECVLVDDGSVDDTWEILREYAQRDARFVTVRKPNTGLSDSLNVGIAHARGEWIARLDADDIAVPHRLERQLQFLRAHPDVVLLGSGFEEIDDQGRVLKRHVYPEGHAGLERRLTTLRGFFPHSSAIFRRDLVADGPAYNARLVRSQDYDLWCRLSERGRMACLAEPLVRIRRHDAQLSFAKHGPSYLTEMVCSAVAHRMRLEGKPDPLTNPSGDPGRFIDWMDRRLKEIGFFDRRQAWLAARNRLFAQGLGPLSILRFAGAILSSGHAGALLMEKVRGSRLPQSMAIEWAREAHAV